MKINLHLQHSCRKSYHTSPSYCIKAFTSTFQTHYFCTPIFFLFVIASVYFTFPILFHFYAAAGIYPFPFSHFLTCTYYSPFAPYYCPEYIFAHFTKEYTTFIRSRRD